MKTKNNYTLSRKNIQKKVHFMLYVYIIMKFIGRLEIFEG